MQQDSRALTTAGAVVIGIAVLMGLLSGGSLFVSLRLRSQVRSVVAKAKRLGQYEIEKRIGKGGMGEVYLAHHAMLRRPTAVKLLHAENSRNLRVTGGMAQRFRQCTPSGLGLFSGRHE